MAGSHHEISRRAGMYLFLPVRAHELSQPRCLSCRIDVEGCASAKGEAVSSVTRSPQLEPSKSMRQCVHVRCRNATVLESTRAVERRANAPHIVRPLESRRSEERRVGKSVERGGRRIIKV